jgi:Histidine kinase-, DNA gyrase B-, and HSP90-like ATPase
MNTSFSFDSQPNAAKLINSLRHLGYNNYSALADLVDNSMDADAMNVYIHVRQRGKEPEIIIADDGCGMDNVILGEAIKLGSQTSKSEESDLGKFGMGLCTASLSIARTTVVLTKTEDGRLLKAINDVEEVIKQGKFRSFLGDPTAEDAVLFNEVTNGASQGTVVILRNCDNLSNKNLSALSGKLSKELSRIFRYFIDAGKSIHLNGKQIQSIDPLEWSNPLTEQFDESDLEISLGDSVENIHVKIAILADDSAKGEKEIAATMPNQGFYVMRNNREMMDGETLELFSKHNDFNRMRIELAFSGKLDKLMGVNFTKKNLSLEQSMEDKLKNYFVGQIATIRKRCRRENTTDTPEEISSIHSDVANEIRKKSKLLMTPSAPKEIRSKNDEKAHEGELRDASGKSRNPSPDRQQQGGFVADGEFKSAAMGAHGVIYEADQIGRKIVITYNSDHPFYSRFILEQGRNDKRIVAGVDYLIYSLACAELKQNNEDEAVNELIGNFKTIMSVNMRTLLS